MATKILMIIPIVVVVFAGIMALQPSNFRVARTAHMRAPAPAVFAQVNDFHEWEAWNPWGKLDPQLEELVAVGEVGSGDEASISERPRRDWRRLHLDW